MTTTDTLLADLADVLDRASKLAAQMAETLADRPSYHPERDGTLGELEPGDSFMWAGTWHKAVVLYGDGSRRIVRCSDGMEVTDGASFPVRIQKRHGNVTIPDDPLRECRLPGGRIAYETTYADQVKVGDWVQRCHGDPDWHLVERAVVVTDPLTLTRMVNVWVENDGSYWWAPTDAIRRATPPADVVADQERKAEASR